MLMKLRIIPFKGSWLRIISYRHYEKMKKRNRFVNCQKHLHWIHLNFQNGAEPHFQKLKKGYFFRECHFSQKICFLSASNPSFFSKNRKFCGWMCNLTKNLNVRTWILVKKWHFWRKNLNRTHFFTKWSFYCVLF